MSHFYTPHFFDPVTSTGLRYSFTGAIKAPREVLKGGYLSWHEPVEDVWWQLQFFHSKPDFKNLGHLEAADPRSAREWINDRTREPYEALRHVEKTEALRSLLEAGKATPQRQGKADSLRAQIKGLKGSK